MVNTDRDPYSELVDWALECRPYPFPNPYLERINYHRLQLEHWLWLQQDDVRLPAVDIGAEYSRPYLPGVLQLNNHCYDTDYAQVRPDVQADVQSLPFATHSLETVIMLETLEHVPNPFLAIWEVARVLKPGGLLLASTPWMWPYHGSPDEEMGYKDYWRFSIDGWHNLLAPWTDPESVSVRPARHTPEGLEHMEQVAGYEVQDLSPWFHGRAATGYFIRARKKEWSHQ